MQWEDLTAPEFSRAVKKSKGLCVLPIGVLEKHGNHLPLGTDLFTGRHIALEAARREPVVIFPPYYFGQIHEARHVPGTVALPGALLLEMLEAVCAEIARNGFDKILIFNSHGGNASLLPFFAQISLERDKGYGLYVSHIAAISGPDLKVKALMEDEYDGHAGEYETSLIMHVLPKLVKMKADTAEEGKVRKGLGLDSVYHGIWWYAESPHHYRGQGRLGSAAKGKVVFEKEVESLVKAIRQVKADSLGPKMMKEFLKKSRNNRGARK